MLRRLVPLLLVAGTLAIVVASAQATPPQVTLTSPSGHTVVNPPLITGVGGHGEGASPVVWVDVFKGGTDGDLATGGDAVFSMFMFANESDGSFSLPLDDA